MGLISFALLFSISAVYLDSYIANKPDFIKSLIAKVNGNMDQVAKYGAAYAVFALVVLLLTSAIICSEGVCLFRLIANIMILIMVAPSLLSQYSEKVKAVAGEKALKTAEVAVSLLKKNEKYIGYAGGIVSLMLFMSI